MERRIKISRDLAKQASHYLAQYHDMFVVWAVKTVEQMPRGMERENFREGVARIFNEIQSCLAKIQDDLGETPESIEAAIAKLHTKEYQKLMDKVQVQAYVHLVKKAMRPWHWPKYAFDYVLTLLMNAVLKIGGPYTKPARRING